MSIERLSERALAAGGSLTCLLVCREQHRRPVECTVVDTHPVLFSQFRTKEFLRVCGELASAPESLRELERCAGADAATARAARRRRHGSLLSWLDPRITADEARASQLEDCRRAEPLVPLYQVESLSLSVWVSVWRARALSPSLPPCPPRPSL